MSEQKNQASQERQGGEPARGQQPKPESDQQKPKPGKGGDEGVLPDEELWTESGVGT